MDGSGVSTDDIVQWGHSLAQIVVSHTAQVTTVTQLPANLLLIDQEVVEEVTLAAPQVVCQTEAGEEGVGGQLPDGKVCEKIVVQFEDGQLLEIVECVFGNCCNVIVMQVELLQLGQTCKLTSSQLGQLVTLKVKNSQLKTDKNVKSMKCLICQQNIFGGDDDRFLTSVNPSREKLVTVRIWLLLRNTV